VNLSLQLLSADLLDQVVALDQACFGQLWSAAQYQRELASPNSDILVLLNQETHALLAYGCVWAIVDEAHITIVAVHPQHRQQGLGQLMLWGLLQAATNRHLARATLEVKVSNQPAIQLYERFGFVTAGRRKKYYADTGEDALILWKGQLQHTSSQRQLDATQSRLHQKLQGQGFHVTVAFDTAENATIDRSMRCQS
jgi:ribosomal-protein-alanine N-acetyltransferase